MFHSDSIRKAQVPVGPSLVYCEVHTDEDVKLFCNNCNVLACSECVVHQHVGHTFTSLKDKAGEARKNLPRVVETLKSNTVPKVQETLKKVKQTLQEHSENGTTVVNSIKRQADELIKETNSVRNKLIHEGERRQSADTKKLEEFENKMEEVLSNAERLVDDCTHTIEPAKDSSLIKLGLDLDLAVPEMEKQMEQIPLVKNCTFVPLKGTVESIRKLFGHCVDNGLHPKDRPSDTSQRSNHEASNHVAETKLEVYFKLRHEIDTGEIMAIATQENQTAWMATYDGTKIKHMDKTGRVNKTIRLSTSIWDIAVTDGGLFVTPNGSGALFDTLLGLGRHYKIKRVKPNGDIVTFVNIEPLMPAGICISRSGYFYVGCVDSFDYDITERSTRSVLKLSSTGVVQQSYQFDNKRQRLFTEPLRIQENINGDVWVRDRTADDKGRIVVLNQDGKLRFIYIGVAYGKASNNFYPCDLTTVGDGTMLICDKKNDRLYNVDENGNHLRFIETRDNGVIGPTSISLDRKHSQLWIGDRRGQVQILNFKLNDKK